LVEGEIEKLIQSLEEEEKDALVYQGSVHLHPELMKRKWVLLA
jgi:hypothetical protein